jgi:hypothetical protein
MSDNLTNAEWRPVGWSPVIYAGAPWRFGAALKGTKPGDITGGSLFVNGVEYSIEANDDRVTFELPPDAVERIPNRAPCSVYIDHADYGRFLWLNGSVTRGGTAQ